MAELQTTKLRGRARQGTRTTTGIGVVIPDNVPQAYELRKANQALTVRNRSSEDISFLARKAYNVMLQIAQETMAATGDDQRVTFETTLKDFERRVGHTTPNGREYLKQILRQLASIQVEFDYRSTRPATAGEVKSWGIANMVAEVYIDEDTATLRWSFPPELSKKMLDPALYNLIDLRTLMMFTSHSALALYEICSRYFMTPSLRTFQDHWTGWSILLSGSREAHKTYREFNKMLTRALAQVREVSPNYEIVPFFTKTGRRVNNLWFQITPVKQPSLLGASPPSAISKELEMRMSELGLPKDDIATLMARFDEEYLLAQLDYTKQRAENKKQEPIASVTGFFMKACEKNFAGTPLRPRAGLVEGMNDGVIEVEAKEVPAPMHRTSVVDTRLDLLKQQWRNAKMKEIREDLGAKADHERLAIVVALEPIIEAQHPTIWVQYQRKGIASASVENYVIELLFAKQYPQDPSAEDLLMFSLLQLKQA
jgi:hypothetical protein